MRFPTIRQVRSEPLLGLSLEYSIIVKLLTEYHLEVLSLNIFCTGLSESTLIKMPHCWETDVVANLQLTISSPDNPITI